MASAADAIQAIRHMVQDHGDELTRLGGNAPVSGVIWFGQLLGWRWPPSYLQVIGKHDGVLVQDAIVFSFLESFQLFLTLHTCWHRPAGYWPVATDGCGNYYALSFGSQNEEGECPVAFFDMIESETEPLEEVAHTYADFVVQHVARCHTPYPGHSSS